MARKSTSSSATQGNGHTPATSKVESKPTSHEEDDTYDSDFDTPEYAAKNRSLPFDPTLLPNGSRSLSLISLQAFGLGLALATCIACIIWCVSVQKPIWRLPAFFACLSFFHFLEFWTTARFNMPVVKASSFLLYSNGKEYNIAHALATLEIILSNFWPGYQGYGVRWYTIALGMLLVFMGQGVRSTAMAEAGTNFNHTPQKVRKEGHELVTTGVYGWLRHPSYFGFFWWALGTQVLVGNKICFFGYLAVLWNFFYRRIRAEEKTLIDFFGKDYEAFRGRTRTGIPFIR